MPVTGSRNGPFGSLIQFLCLGFRVEGSETTCSKVVLPFPFSEDFDDEVDGGDGSDGDYDDDEDGHDAPSAASVTPPGFLQLVATTTNLCNSSSSSYS